MLTPEDPMAEPTNRALLRALAIRLTAGYATLPGREADCERWADIAFKAAAPPQIQQPA